MDISNSYRGDRRPGATPNPARHVPGSADREYAAADGGAWGVVQLSDRAEKQNSGHDDVETLTTFVTLLIATLQALRNLRDQRVNSHLAENEAGR